MANEPQPLATGDAPSEEDYAAFCAALSASARGRAFLAEHARRQRLGDTEMLLDAMQRLEAQVAATPAPGEPVREDVILDAIRALRNEIGADVATQIATLTAFVEDLRARLDAVAAVPAVEAPPEPDVEIDAVIIAAPAAAETAMAEAPAADASAIPEVSWFDTLPQDAAGEAPHEAAPAEATTPEPLAIAFVAEIAEREAAAHTEAAEEAEPPEAKVIKAGTIPPPEPFAGEDFSAAPAVKTVPQTDLLASIMSLSDDERTALFT